MITTKPADRDLLAIARLAAIATAGATIDSLPQRSPTDSMMNRQAVRILRR
jgi:hypothetical protein